jgi:hypothetical protein
MQGIVAATARAEHPSLEGPARGKRTMAPAAPIVRKNY